MLAIFWVDRQSYFVVLASLGVSSCDVTSLTNTSTRHTVKVLATQSAVFACVHNRQILSFLKYY